MKIVKCCFKNEKKKRKKRKKEKILVRKTRTKGTHTGTKYEPEYYLLRSHNNSLKARAF